MILSTNLMESYKLPSKAWQELIETVLKTVQFDTLNPDTLNITTEYI